MSGKNEKRVFLDMAVDNVAVGRIEIKLFVDDAPKTCENFRALCTGEVGMAPNNKARLHYKGNEMHRIVKKFMIQGGDITEGDGRGGYSIYGRYFDDEKFVVKHSKPYLVSMANKGPNSNSSQFFITTAAAPHCNLKHVVFGEVVKGQHVVDLIENVTVDEMSRPTVKVEIANCGELIKKRKVNVAVSEEQQEAEKKRLEEKNAIPECPKSWLYREDANGDRPDGRRREDRRRSGERSRENRTGWKTREREARSRDDKDTIKIRGRGGVRYRKERSLTPEYWKMCEPKKWNTYKSENQENPEKQSGN